MTKQETQREPGLQINGFDDLTCYQNKIRQYKSLINQEEVMVKYTSDILPYDIGRMNYTVRLLMQLKDDVDNCLKTKYI